MGMNTADSTSVMPTRARRDLGHRLARGLLGGQAFLAHHALDVFHHHDGVVHQQADGQHHGEHGQRVDRIAGCRQHTERAQQHHRHGNGRNQRGAQFCKKMNMTSTTSTMASSRALTTSSIEALTNGVVS
jgi:hypothetical protein